MSDATRFPLAPKSIIAFLEILAFALAGIGIFALLRPPTGLQGVYSTPGESGRPVTVATRRDSPIDFANPPILLSPFFQHWNLSLLPVPASLPPFEVRWVGYLKSPIPGAYRFLVDSEGQSRLRLDGRELLPEAGRENEGTVATLAPGWHALELDYRRGEENPGIRFLWQPPGTPLPELVPQNRLAPSEESIRTRGPKAIAGVASLAAWLWVAAVLWRRRARPGSPGELLVRHRHEFLLGGILVLGFVLRVHQFDQIPFHHETADEYQHGWEGWSLLHQGIPTAWTFYPQLYSGDHLIPFQWFGDPYYLARPYFDHPPGFSLLVGATCSALGAEQMLDCTLARMRWVPILLGTFTIFLVGRAGWRFFPDRASGTLAALLYATLPVIVLGNRLVKAESLLAAILLLQAGWLQSYLENGRNAAVLKVAAGGAASLWAKATGIAVPLSAFLILMGHRKRKAATLVAGAAAGAIALYFCYGAYFGWDQFTAVLTQQASKRVALRTLLDLAGISKVVELQFGAGWYLWMGIALAILSLGRQRALLVPALVYLGVMALSADSRGVFGWYRLPLYPFLCLAGGEFLATWWRDKDPARGFLFGMTALCASLSYAFPDRLGTSRLAVLLLLALLSLGPLWMLLAPGPVARRVRDACMAVALLLFFAANLSIVANQVPIYVREGGRGRVAVPAKAPSP